MRNLKKLLALVLALVMSLALVTVASAKSASDFADGEDITYTEAVDVMTAIGVFEGVGNNTFDPNTVVTREQAAKIVTYMLMPKADADRLTTTVAPYADVAAGRWSAGAIAYCTNEGILAGVGGGKFNPTGQLTCLQFAKIMLTALGYDAKQESLVGSSWAINTATLAIRAGLDEELKDISLSSAMTRQQAAQMAFNTLKADLVDYETNTSVTVGDVTFSVSGKAQVVETTQTYGTTIKRETATPYVVQFAEQYQPDLANDTSVTNDDFGRPAHGWTFDGESIDAYSDTPVATFTGAVKAAEVAKTLGGYKLAAAAGTPTYNINDTSKYYTDASPNAKNDFSTAATVVMKPAVAAAAGGTALAVGDTNANGGETIAKAIADETANGKLVEVYADTSNVITKIVEVTYTAGQVSDVTTRSDRTIYSVQAVTTPNAAVTGNTYVDEDTADTAVFVGELKEDDYVTYVQANNKLYIYPTTSFVGAQSEKDTDTVTISGTKYNLGVGVNKNTTPGLLDNTSFPNSTDNANYYVDQYGYVVWTDAIENELNFAVVDRIAAVGATGTGGNQSAEAVLVLTDGSTKTVNVTKINGVETKNATTSGTAQITHAGSGAAATALVINSTRMSSGVSQNAPLEGKVVTYTEKDGNYELTYVLDTAANQIGQSASFTTASNPVISKGDPAVEGVSVNGRNDTVYIIKTMSGTDEKFSVYTGFKAAPTVTLGSGGSQKAGVSYGVDRDGNVTVVYVDATAIGSGGTVGDTATGAMLYVTNKNIGQIDSGSDAVYTLKGIVDGAVDVVVRTKTQSIFSGLTAGKLYELRVDDDGYVTAVNEQNNTDETGPWVDAYKAYTVGANESASGGVFDLGTAVSGSDGTNAKTFTYSDTTKVIVIDDNEVTGSDITSAKQGDTVYVKVVDTTATNGDQLAIEVIYIIKAAS